MILDLLVWSGLVLAACLGVAIRTVAASMRDLRTTLLPQQVQRLHRLKVGGGAASILGWAGAAAVAVMGFVQVTPDPLPVAIGAGAAVFLARIAEEIARMVALRNLEGLARPFLGDAVAFLPIIEPHAEATVTEVRDDALQQMVEASEKAGLIESDEHEMINGVIRLDRTAAREIMVPRIDVVGIEIQTPLSAALDVMLAGAHSRVPVFEESIDHVVGVLYAKDLLRMLRDGKMDEPLASAVRPPHFVPETKPLDELLQELQQAKVHMAIIVDEYGGTAGIVTIEDVLEEIVGEIQDEYDVEEPLIERVGDAEAIVNARVSITDVNDALSVNLPDASDTLAGLVYQRLQRVPKPGDQVHMDDVILTVLSVVGRRIKKVRVNATPPSHTSEVTESDVLGGGTRAGGDKQ